MYKGMKRVITHEFYALVRQLCLRDHYAGKRTVRLRHLQEHYVLVVGPKMAMVILILLFVAPTTFGVENYRRDNFIDKFSSGMKFAYDFLGTESVALKVADFVVRAFSTVNTKNAGKKQTEAIKDTIIEDNSHVDESSYEENRPNVNLHQTSSPVSPWRHLIRLLGLQPNQISAVAVNALVFVAQMISTFLSGTRHSKVPHRSDDPSSWILTKSSKRLQDLIITAKNETLPDNIGEFIKEHEFEEETSCIRLLVCKIKPFINKMQKTIFNNDNSKNHYTETSGAGILYRYLPATEEIDSRSQLCEKRHKDCNLNE
ncbi:uncharacterized protein [Battus philenor]|uniref:uncharacterized protein n=1 Tax=Battus philenor TaxID=42288 RepID=UPI0035CED733